ncbi:hypothetical protein AVEN_243239-1 [Araneus ventricosus]|uniref:Uncharacterized protein n=1 Tax=Araneus ventricosus TaxID=182803 RepID=A0A4Y2TB91_ARAVE|nr:hypothetical protein AVEN_243239-1 [Araneus ventricosus]
MEPLMEQMFSLDDSVLRTEDLVRMLKRSSEWKQIFFVEALTMTTEDKWPLSEIQKTELADPDIRPILKLKLNSENRSSSQEIARECPATKRYWTLWNSLYLKDDALYRKWESNEGDFYRRQLILPKSRIQEVLREIHDIRNGRHFGVIKILLKTPERF